MSTDSSVVTNEDRARVSPDKGGVVELGDTAQDQKVDDVEEQSQAGGWSSDEDSSFVEGDAEDELPMLEERHQAVMVISIASPIPAASEPKKKARVPHRSGRKGRKCPNRATSAVRKPQTQ